MTTLFGLLAIGLGFYAIKLQNKVDELIEDNERLMDCIIDIENEMGERE